MEKGVTQEGEWDGKAGYSLVGRWIGDIVVDKMKAVHIGDSSRVGF